MIDDTLGLKLEPELLKMSAVYVMIAKAPENWFRNIKNNPIIKPFFAGFVTEIKS